MEPVILFLLSMIAYAAGLYIIWKITPRLYPMTIGDGLFMAWAALDILGGLLAFGGIVVALAAFNSTLGIKIIGFFLFVGLLLLTLRMALRSLRGRAAPFRLTYILAGCYCLFLAGASIFAIIQLFR